MLANAQRSSLWSSWLICLTASLAGVPDEDEFIAGPVLTIDARTLADGAVVHLVHEARAGGFELESIHPSYYRRLRVLEVIDTDPLRVESDRGTEIVALYGVGGADPRLPDEVGDFIKHEGRARLAELLARSDVELLELPLLVGQGAWHFPDERGYRLVSPSVLAGDSPHELLLSVLRGRGWAIPGHPYLDMYGTRGESVLFPDMPGEPRTMGLYALPAMRALQERVEADRCRIRDLSEDELTWRGRAIQAQMATLLSWTPQEQVVVRWGTEEHVQEMLTEAVRESSRRQGMEEPNSSEVARAVQRIAADMVAWSPPGPEIFLRAAWAPASEANLDAALAHEIAHQYQEETWFPDGAYPQRQGLFLPVEGHAVALANAWLAQWRPGVVDASHVDAAREFVALMEAWEATPDDVVDRFAAGLGQTWSGLLMGRAPPIGPAAKVSCRTLGREEHDLLVELTNHGNSLFDAQCRGDWFAARSDPWAPDAVPAAVLVTSPPFNLLLPGGASVRLRLRIPSDPFESSDLDTVALIELRPAWSLTPSRAD